MTVNLQYRCDKRVSVSLWTRDIFHLQGFWVKSCGFCFSSAVKQRERRELQGTTVSAEPCMPTILCALLIDTDPMEGRVSEVREVAPASSESDVCEHFVFALVEKKRKEKRRQTGRKLNADSAVVASY